MDILSDLIILLKTAATFILDILVPGILFVITLYFCRSILKIAPLLSLIAAIIVFVFTETFCRYYIL